MVQTVLGAWELSDPCKQCGFQVAQQGLVNAGARDAVDVEERKRVLADGKRKCIARAKLFQVAHGVGRGTQLLLDDLAYDGSAQERQRVQWGEQVSVFRFGFSKPDFARLFARIFARSAAASDAAAAAERFEVVAILEKKEKK